MAFTFDEQKELELLKQKHKLDLNELQAVDREIEHLQKMERLNKMLEIAKAGGVRKEC